MTELTDLFDHLDRVEQHERDGRTDTINVAPDMDDVTIEPGTPVFDPEEYGYGVITAIDADADEATLRVSTPSIGLMSQDVPVGRVEPVPVDRVPTYSTPTGSARDLYR